MIYVQIALCAAMLHACLGPFSKTPQQALDLEIRVSSLDATASLSWQRPPGRQFLYAEVERAAGEAFAPIARLDSPNQTAYTDVGVHGDTAYRYRIVWRYGKGDKIARTLYSHTANARIHPFVAAWRLPAGFRPTRLAVGPDGSVAVVGAGWGQILRFDAEGTPLPPLTYTDQPLACLETAALDGPGLAYDAAANLYVAFNVRTQGAGPQAQWSKFDSDGDLLWNHPLQGIFARHLVLSGDDQIFIESISQLQQFDAAGRQLSHETIPALLVSCLRFWDRRFAALIEPIHVDMGWKAPRLVVYGADGRTDYDLTLGRDPLVPQDRGGGLLRRPSDFAVDEAHARAFVVNAGAGRVEVFRDGAYLTQWGGQGQGQGDFRFSGPLEIIDDIRSGQVVERQVTAGGIALDGTGDIYVADPFNDRIQKFSR